MKLNEKNDGSEITTATKITIARIVLLPVILFFYLCGGEGGIIPNVSFLILYGKLLALVFFVVAAFSDWLDGYVARKYNQITVLGKLLDPIADKLLTLLGFILVALDFDIITNGFEGIGFISVWFMVIALFITVARDFVVNALRQVAAEKGVTIAADKFGKIKSTLQYCAITLLMFYAFDSVNNFTIVIGVGVLRDVYEFSCVFFLSLATILSIYSAINYLIKYSYVFRGSEIVQVSDGEGLAGTVAEENITIDEGEEKIAISGSDKKDSVGNTNDKVATKNRKAKGVGE